MSVDLKTLTPGTAASSSVLVGATSAAAASPSLFTTTGSGNVVLSASPTITGNTVVSSGSFGLSGNISSAAWTTSGIRYANVAATLTDTSSTGTVATAYTDVFGGNTIAASNATTFTNYYTAWVGAPTAGTNVTFTGKWALGLGGSLQINGGTVTTNTTPALDISQTWNEGAGTVTFTGLKLNVTDTKSQSGSLLLDLQVGGTSRFIVGKNGSSINYLNATDYNFSSPARNFGGYLNNLGRSTTLIFDDGSNNGNGQGLITGANGAIRWQSLNRTDAGTSDLFLTRAAAATLQLGAADAAAPVAQTLQVQSVVAGTTNTAGTNFTIAGSKGTGTGAGGSIIFQVAPAGTTGTAQNALATALAINSAGLLQFAGTTSSFPALKRSSATLQVRLADDSAFAAVQGKLTTDTAYTAGDPATTGYLVIYDSNGTAYKVPALAV